jgi:hypothetical protein
MLTADIKIAWIKIAKTILRKELRELKIGGAQFTLITCKRDAAVQLCLFDVSYTKYAQLKQCMDSVGALPLIKNAFIVCYWDRNTESLALEFAAVVKPETFKTHGYRHAANWILTEHNAEFSEWVVVNNKQLTTTPTP